ncbi:MAG: DUF2336 domain-containing protein [Kordiimonadaceae bacterium]|nr:DUF2336 domain-containing protein [Kordiimonadaceae bacterium]
MSGSIASLIDAGKMEKMILAKRVGQFLSSDQADDERAVVEDVARQLAADVSFHVRKVLAFELRRCDRLVPDVAEKIAKDIETVSGSFLGATQAFSDKGLVKLIPQLTEYARAVLAKRPDLSDVVIEALARMGDEGSVTSLVRNDRVSMPEMACSVVVRRFSENRRVMDHFSGRGDLPVTIIEQIADKVSEHCKEVLISAYGISADVAIDVLDNTKIALLYENVQGLEPMQIHTIVRELRENGKLTEALAIDIAKKGCAPFLESSLALRAGVPLKQVKEILTLKDRLAFVRLMHKADFGKSYAPSVLKFAKKQYG